MRKQWSVLLLTLLVGGSLALPTAAAEKTGAVVSTAEVVAANDDVSANTVKEDAEGTASFENLETRVRKGSLSIMSLEETIESINAIDFDKMKDDLKDSLNDISQSQWMLISAGLSDSYTYQQLESAYDSLKDTFEDLQEGDYQKNYADTVFQLKDAQNQVVKGAQAMYVAILDLESKSNGLRRDLNALDRSIKGLELRYSLGQISNLQLQQAKSGRASMASGLQTLQMNITNYKCQLEMMLGIEITGTIKLAALPDITDTQLSEMITDKDLTAAMGKSFELYAAKLTLEDAEEDYKDAKKEYGHKTGSYQMASAEHAHQAAQYTYQSVVANYKQKFRTLYAQVGDYKQILATAETSLIYQNNEFAAAKTKYDLGKISLNDLLSAQDARDKAQDNVLGAKRDLFSAFNSYRLAVDNGLLN